MLRLLHTADWHLGHTLCGLDRTREHEAFLAWLLDTLASERVDALLVAGDVFDAANPPAAATRLWYGFLARAWSRLPGLQVVVVGGNHDSAARLDAPHPLLRELGRLCVVGGLPRLEGKLDCDRAVVPLRDEVGRVAAVVAAIPFLRPADLPPLTMPAGGGDDPLLDAVRALHTEVLDAARARAAAEGEGVALLALGHLYLAGGQVSELSERRILGGNLHALPDSLFPGDVAYAALGHLHLAQRVGAREHVRYAGSPIPLSFDECGYRHQVVRVDIEGPTAVSVRALDTPQAQALRRFPGAEPGPLAEVVKALRALPAAADVPEDVHPWLDVRVVLTGPEPGLRATLEAAADGRAARLVRIAPPRHLGNGAALPDAAPGRTLSDLGYDDVFLGKWERDHGGAPPAEVLAAYRELVEVVLHEEVVG